MTYTDYYSEHVTNILKKLKKKDKKQFDIVLKKIDEILVITPANPEHYKPLKKGMSGFRRVHVQKSFVLIFKIDTENETIHFEDYDHHDNIYKKYR